MDAAHPDHLARVATACLDSVSSPASTGVLAAAAEGFTGMGPLSDFLLLFGGTMVLLCAVVAVVLRRRRK